MDSIGVGMFWGEGRLNTALALNGAGEFCNVVCHGLF